MNKIKFRAWMVEDEYMEDPRCVTELMDHLPIIRADFTRAPFILLQDTGVKDKNNDEIYEGFIIKIPYGRTCIVKRAEHMSAFVLADIGDDSNINNVLLKVDSACYEIIGNIYENPELLEK